MSFILLPLLVAGRNARSGIASKAIMLSPRDPPATGEPFRRSARRTDGGIRDRPREPRLRRIPKAAAPCERSAGTPSPAPAAQGPLFSHSRLNQLEKTVALNRAIISLTGRSPAPRKNIVDVPSARVRVLQVAVADVILHLAVRGLPRLDPAREGVVDVIDDTEPLGVDDAATCMTRRLRTSRRASRARCGCPCPPLRGEGLIALPPLDHGVRRPPPAAAREGPDERRAHGVAALISLPSNSWFCFTTRRRRRQSANSHHGHHRQPAVAQNRPRPPRLLSRRAGRKVVPVVVRAQFHAVDPASLPFFAICSRLQSGHPSVGRNDSRISPPRFRRRAAAVHDAPARPAYHSAGCLRFQAAAGPAHRREDRLAPSRRLACPRAA